MTERIVVGIDGSLASRAALEWVADRCARKSALVEVVNVVWDLTGGRADSLRLLADAERAIRDRVPDQQVQFHRAEGGVVPTLSDFSATADMLVIGVDPEHPVRAAFGGWLPVRMAAHARVPVCVVPAGWTQIDGAITVGLADDDSSQQALLFAAREALDTGTGLHLVHAWRYPDPFVDGTAAVFEQPERVHERQRARLESTARRLRKRFAALEVTSDLMMMRPAQALLAFRDSSALIVIGTHGEGVLAGGLSAAVGQDLLWTARRPVCVVPPWWDGFEDREDR